MKAVVNAWTDVEPLKVGASTGLAQRAQRMRWAIRMVQKKEEMVQ